MNESFKAAGINHQESKDGNNNTESLSLSPSFSSNKDDGEIAVLDELPPLKKPKVVHPIEAALWNEVEISLEAVNIVKKGGPARSKLVSILGFAISNLSVQALRKFGSKHLIRKSRKMTKVELCDAILDGKAKNNKGIPDGEVISEVAVKIELPCSRIRALLVAKKDCFKVSPETFHSWLVSQDIVTMADLMEACEDDEFVAEEMRNGGLKAFKKKRFVKAVSAHLHRVR